MTVDGQRGKFYSTVEDGYHWQNDNGYARTELSYGTDGLPFDTAKIYDMYWKGYFPQDFSYLAANQIVVCPMQIHGNGGGINSSVYPYFIKRT